MRKLLTLMLAAGLLVGCAQTSTTSSSSSSSDTEAEETAKACPVMVEKAEKNKLIYADDYCLINLAEDVQGEDYFKIILKTAGFKDKYNVDLSQERTITYTFSYDDTKMTEGSVDVEADDRADSYGFSLDPIAHQDQSKVSKYVLTLDVDGQTITLEMTSNQE